MSPLEQAIDRIRQRGWFMRALGRGEFDSVKPWYCSAYPAHLGGYHEGTRIKSGMYSVYSNAMVRFTGAGGTALEAVNDVIAQIDASAEKHVYEALEQVFEDLLHAHREKTGNLR